MGKHVDGSDKRYVWVMTIDENWDEIIFWDVKAHQHFTLKGRIQEPERKYLEFYLSPVLT